MFSSEMKNRIFYGTLMIAVMVLCVFLSDITRLLGFLAVGIACSWEYWMRLREKNIPVGLWILILFQAACAAVVYTDLPELAALPVLLILSIFLTMFYGVTKKEQGGVAAVYTLAGILYPGVLFAVVMYISQSSWWLYTLMLACLSTWVCDSAAMLGGRRFGKHKLAATVSPNKTVEGFWWGAASSLLVGVLCWALSRWFAMPQMNLLGCMVTCLLASTMGQLGDLAESLLKRMLDIKDFSNLIPGHGGLFDRADSLLFSIPTAYLCIAVYAALI